MMRRRNLNPLTRRWFWLALGGPVAAAVALCVVFSVSLFPPGLRSKHLGYYLATTQLNIMPNGAIGNADPFADPSQFAGPALVIANVMSSPELRNLIARQARIRPSDLAVDAPVPTYLPIAAQEPTGEKRSTQIIVEQDPYRLTIDATQALPNIGITAQAPSPQVAQRIAAAAQPALSAYLTGVETNAGTPLYERLVTRQLAPVQVAPDPYGGTSNVMGFAFLIGLTLWVGLVLTISAVGRDVRVLREKSPTMAHARKFS